MTVTIQFPAEIESTLRRRAATLGQDVESFVCQVVAESLAYDDAAAPTPPRTNSHEEFKAKLRQIIDRHSVSMGRMDDSRESIYAGCGE
jgi:hypothetical protein